MPIKIGHASIDERGKVSGGTAGDFNGREVCIREWYSKPWTVVLRPKDAAVAEKMAKACEAACANAKIGYDQGQRNTLHTRAKAADYDLAKISTPCECDCSSLMTVCAIAGGVSALEYTGNAPTTRTMQAKFTATGAFEALTDSKYLTTDKYLRRGDILLKPSSHTAMALEDGAGAASTSTYNLTLRTLKKGCEGEDVAALQRLLIANGYDCGRCGADGDFGAATDAALTAYQEDHGLPPDGIAGKHTMTALLGL